MDHSPYHHGILTWYSFVIHQWLGRKKGIIKEEREKQIKELQSVESASCLLKASVTKHYYTDELINL